MAKWTLKQVQGDGVSWGYLLGGEFEAGEDWGWRSYAVAGAAQAVVPSFVIESGIAAFVLWDTKLVQQIGG